jgi:hypothetical protein
MHTANIIAVMLWAVFYWIGLIGPQFSLYNLRILYISVLSKRFSLSAASETLINTSVYEFCSSNLFGLSENPVFLLYQTLFTVSKC